MVRRLLCLTFLFVSQQAEASPWGRPDDGVYMRAALHTGEVEGLSASRVDLYGEYGLSERWTATAKYERVTFDGFSEFAASGWRTTLRRTLPLSGNMVASLEGGVLEGEAIGGAAGCQSFGGEARGGLGQSFTLGSGTNHGDRRRRYGFWFAEVAARAHSDGCQRYRLETGIGREVSTDIWLIAQAWFDQGSENARSQKYQVEYLWRRGALDLSIGSLVELGGEFEEKAVFFSIARRF